MDSEPAPPDARLAGDVRLRFQSALVIFLVTVVIGILNGLDLVDFSRNQLLTHVHAGTLGWITLAVLAATLWLLGEGGPVAEREAAAAHRLSVLTVAAIALYVAAFAAGSGLPRPVAGTLALLALGAFYGWAVRRARRLAAVTVPQLAILAALTTLVIGAVLGVLLGLRAAGRLSGLPDGLAGAQPALSGRGSH
jgi:hypothetical protein